MRKLLAAGLAVVLVGPMLILVGVGTLANSISYPGLCAGAGLSVAAHVPASLSATRADGRRVTLGRRQLGWARTIILVGSHIAGAGTHAILIALMAALTESGLRQLANTDAYPQSGAYPNDGDGSDHDSLGLFQMRPHSGWGTVGQLMDATYQARAFYGGQTGPNHGSPRGLLDIPGWQQLDLAQAAQAVELSAYPSRYAAQEPVARTILAALTAAPGTTAQPGGNQKPQPSVAATQSLVFPLPSGSYRVTDGFGPRIDPITRAASFHPGTDFAAPDSTTIMALAGGRVTYAGMEGGTQGRITILSVIGGDPVAVTYLHMWSTGIFVHPGDRVVAGQQIGRVGSSGHSTGPHLHLEIHPGGTGAPAVDPQKWLAAHHITVLAQPHMGPGCSPQQ